MSAASRCPDPGAARGASLVVVLAAVLILSGLLISYLASMRLDRSSTRNYSQSVAVQEIALGAVQEILGDFFAEIAAGSLPDGTPAGAAYGSGANRVYVPAADAAAWPARIGFAAASYTNDVSASLLPPTLIRVSRASDPFYASPPSWWDTGAHPPPASRSSAVPTSTPSANGRAVTPARWNKPLLLGAAPPTAFSVAPPDWIYVTRSGSRVCTAADLASLGRTGDLSQTGQLLGRYAYVVYDEGGLLDANVAGAPASAASSAALAGKTFLSYADLAQLPGLSPSIVDALVRWRNKGGLSSYATYTNLVSNTATNGFLNASAGDNPFLGRQDLIDYMTKVAGAASALPYLGTFSRAVNGPAWRPTANASDLGGSDGAGSIYAYRNRSETDGAPNRDLANLRWPASASIVHYADDGTVQSYSVNAGDPFLSRRFSLARIGWLAGDPATGPADTSKQAAIQAAFGLVWSSYGGNPCWKYVGAAGGAAQTAIETLDQVARENREPNFFELLKAGILSGSLGKDPGAMCTIATKMGANLDPTQVGPCGYYFDQYGPNKDRQIIQIGANLIDQFDRDGYPTAIYFAVASDPAYPEQEPVNMCYGIENLPYLQTVDCVAYNQTLATVDGWLQPELWNPHQAPAASWTGGRPTQFRAVASGSVYVSWYLNGTSPQVNGQAPPVDFDTSARESQIYFSDAGGTASPFYAHPQLLTTANADLAATDPIQAWQSSYTTSDPRNPFVGFHAGTAPYNPPAVISNWADAEIIPNPMYTICLQYKDPGGIYRPYSFLSRIEKYSYVTSTSGTSPQFAGLYGLPFTRPDPRTDRFSVAFQNWWDVPNATMQAKNASANRVALFKGQPRPSSGFYYNGSNSETASALTANVETHATLADWAQNQWDAANLTAYYTDPDGVARPGDGFRGQPNSASSTGDGCELFHSTSLTASAVNRRPVILNRPFFSAGEMGYAHRDLPFKTLDFFSPLSADAGLLDLFSAVDEPPVSAGQVNLNDAPAPVLQAILAGASKQEITPTLVMAPADAKAVAQAVSALLGGRAGVLTGRADLAAKLSAPIQAGLAAAVDRQNKTFAEAPVRALAPVANARTWNLLIDVIAQSGQMSPAAATLGDFLVQGERRYWLHVAIDRLTGKVIDQQMEPVYE